MTLQVIDAANATIVAINTMLNAGANTANNSAPAVVSNTSNLMLKYGYDSQIALTTNTSVDLRAYNEISIQVANISGGDIITVSKSLDNVTFFQEYVSDNISEFFVDTISANGLYVFMGSSYVKWQKTGSNSSPIIDLTSTLR